MEQQTQHPNGAPWYLVIILIVVAVGASLAAILVTIAADNMPEQRVAVEEQNEPADSEGQQSDQVTEDTQNKGETSRFATDAGNPGIEFEYPISWHIYEMRQFDNPGRTTPIHNIYLSMRPLRSVSPSGGPGMRYDIRLSRMEDDAVYVEEFDTVPSWMDVTADEVAVAGQMARRVTVVTDISNPDSVYVPQFQQVVYLEADQGLYRLEYQYDELTDEGLYAWELMLDTLTL